MISEHNEIEAKLDAPFVSFDAFKKFALGTLGVERYEVITGTPDVYYEAGANVVRHRINPSRHELTVKRRTSTGSTRDREEIDLHFAKKTQPEDTAAFLRAVGFKEAFTLVKEAHIFWVRLSPQLQATFVIYDVWRAEEPTKKRRFVEIEAEKGSPCTPETGKRHVRAWVKKLQDRFDLGEPLNESLYEIYSGKRYQSV